MFQILPNYLHYLTTGFGSATDHNDGINLSGNLYTTGSNLYNLITGISGQSSTCSTFNSIFLYNNSLGGFNEVRMTGANGNQSIVIENNVNSVLCSGNVLTTITGVNILTGTKVSAINVTGFGNQTGIINFSGLGSVTVLTGIGNAIYISGSSVGISADHSDGINLSGNLTTTGQTLYNIITGVSGNLPFYNLSDFGSLSNAIAAIGSKSGTLIIPISGNVTSSLLTVPYNIDLLFTNSGMLNIASGAELRIQGNIIAQNRQIFSNIHTGLNKGNLHFYDNRSIEKYMLPWFGPPNDRSANALPIIQGALDCLESNQTLYAPIGQKYRIDSTINLSGKFGVGFVTDPSRYEINSIGWQSSVIYWYGPSGGTMLNMKVCEHCEINGWVWDCGPSGAFTGINIDGEHAPTISTDNRIINNKIFGPGVTGLYKFMGIAIAANSSNNNEFMKIINTEVINYPGDSGYGYGLYFGPNSNAHGHVIENSAFYYLDHGVHAENAGFIMEGINNFGFSQVNILVGERVYPTIIRGADTEQSQIFCYVSGGGDPLIIESNRIGEADTCAVRYSLVGGNVQFSNNRISFAPIVHDATNCTSLRLVSSNNSPIATETGEFYNFGLTNLYTTVDRGYFKGHVQLLSGSRDVPALKFTSGLLTQTPFIQSGVVEWDGTQLYITQFPGPNRETVVTTLNNNSKLLGLDVAYDNSFTFNFNYKTSGFYKDLVAIDSQLTFPSSGSRNSFATEFMLVQGNPQTNIEKYIFIGGYGDDGPSNKGIILPIYSTLYTDSSNINSGIGAGGGLHNLIYTYDTGLNKIKIRMRSIGSGEDTDSLYTCHIRTYNHPVGFIYPSTATGIDTGIYTIYDNTLITQGDGKVGIGIRFPRYPLDVIGDGHFTDGLFVSGQSVSTGNLNASGQNLQNSINVLSGNLITTGQTLYQYIINTSGNLDNRLYQTGSNIIALINASAGGVSILNNASGILSLTGRGNVTVISGGVGLIYISGDTSAISGFVKNTSISVTGFPAQTGLIGLSGAGNITVFTGINNNIIISGSSVGSSSINGLLVTGTGTLNYVPKFTNNSGLINSSIYETGGFVGIGMTTPQAILSVGTQTSPLPSNTSLWIQGGKTVRLGSSDGDASYGAFIKPDFNGSFSTLTFGTRDLGVDTEAFKLLSGNAGFGVEPVTSARISLGGAAAKLYFSNAAAGNSIVLNAPSSTWLFGLQVTGVGGFGRLSLGRTTSVTNAFSQEDLTLYDNGNIGIGMSVPTSKLSVSGHIIAKNITGDNLNILNNAGVSGTLYVDIIRDATNEDQHININSSHLFDSTPIESLGWSLRKLYGDWIVDGLSGIKISGYNINALGTLTISGHSVSTGQSDLSSCSAFNSVFLYNNSLGGFNEVKMTGANGNQSLVIENNVNSVSCSGNLITTISGVNIATKSELYQTGVNLMALITAAATGVSAINGLSGLVSIVGTGDIYVTKQGQVIIVSGNSGNFATRTELFNTGSNLYNLISNATGYINTNPSGYLTSGQFTGHLYRPTQLYSGFNPINIDFSSGNVFKYMLTGNVNFNFTNARDGQTVVIGISNTGGLNKTVVWPATVHWPSDTIPTLSSGSKMDVFTAIKIFTGFYMNVVQNFSN